MAITTRNISVQLYKINGEPLAGAEVSVRLVGMGVDSAGLVIPAIKNRVTDENGSCTFQLWQNDQSLSNTHYEITCAELNSFDPVTRRPTLWRDRFIVSDSDNDVRNLIQLTPAQIDPNAALLAQIASDRQAVTDMLSQAQSILAQVQAIADSIGNPDPVPTAEYSLADVEVV